MYKLRFLPCVLVLFFMFPATAQQQQTAKLDKKGNRPPSGYVPDAATAVKIAEAVLIPVYGEQKIVSERPFKATLDGDVWTVAGTLYCGDGKSGMCPGGTATVKLSKDDARVLFMIHYK
jgi:hypothetical protein